MSALASRHRDVEAESQEVLVRHAQSFRWAQLFLSDAQRRDSAIAYAFCRLVDDTVDEATSPDRAREGLSKISDALESGRAGDDLISAYTRLADRRGFGLGPARDLILGAQSDLGPVELDDDPELGTYCYRVAGTVGLMMCGILGVTEPRAKKHAVDLGVAMQLTNICRDVREDAGRGRIYLPRSRLHAHGLSSRDFFEESRLDDREDLRARLRALVAELLDVADQAYASGEGGLRYLPSRARLAICVASRVYGGIGRRLKRVRACDPWLGRVRVPSHEKLWLTTRALGLWASVSLFPPTTSASPSTLPLLLSSTPEK